MGAPEHTTCQVTTGNVTRRGVLAPPPLTLFTGADVEHAGAQAVPGRDAETRVGWVQGHVGEHLAGGGEAIPGDPLHPHVGLIQSVQRPGKQSHILVKVPSEEEEPQRA